MNTKLLPRQMLFATHDTYEVRAWARGWDEALSDIFDSDEERRSRGLALLADLTSTPRSDLREIAAITRSEAELLDRLANYWAEAGSDPATAYRTHTLPDGTRLVEPPFNGEAVRAYLAEWKRRAEVFDAFVTNDPRMLAELQKAMEHAAGDATILILGESGTGKELLALEIHRVSDRSEHPFEPLNCSAVPETLFEAELFGHEKGAFTGADRTRKGLVEVVGSGTLFLDEVGELALESQPKLLRLLRERESRRVGVDTRSKVRARFIAATNADLATKVRDGTFRPDLLQRLNGCMIELPPLRERRGDIRLLTDRFMSNAKHEGGISTAVRDVLDRYDWPANVAELEQTVLYAARGARGREIDVTHLPEGVIEAAYPRRGDAAQILLAAEAATEIATGARSRVEPSILQVFADRELENPPLIGGDKNVDDLVQAVMDVAGRFLGEDPATLPNAIVVLRRAALLAKLRQVVQSTGAPEEIVGRVNQLLTDTLGKIQGSRVAGLVAHIVTEIFSSDDDDVGKLREAAIKVMNMGPLIKIAVEAFSRSMHAAGPATGRPEPIDVTPSIAPPTPAASIESIEGTTWMDERNRPSIEKVIHEEHGNITAVARKLKIDRSHVARLVRKHGLDALVKSSRQRTNGEGGSPSADGQPSADQAP
jgi:DNA-binding NtrC family response regulator